jgi:phage-related protein
MLKTLLGRVAVIYAATLRDAVFVLHSFQKKTQRTSKQDIEVARQRYKRIGA